MFEVFDREGNDVTNQEEWYIDVNGDLFFMTNDIDSPLMDAESFGFIYKMKVGDIVFSCYSSTTIDAIGVVTGDYEWCNGHQRT